MSTVELSQREPRRFPKACKAQLFTRQEEVWLKAAGDLMRSGYNVKLAASNADILLTEFRQRFGE